MDPVGEMVRSAVVDAAEGLVAQLSDRLGVERFSKEVLALMRDHCESEIEQYEMKERVRKDEFGVVQALRESGKKVETTTRDDDDDEKLVTFCGIQLCVESICTQNDRMDSVIKLLPKGIMTNKRLTLECQSCFHWEKRAASLQVFFSENGMLTPVIEFQCRWFCDKPEFEFEPLGEGKAHCPHCTDGHDIDFELTDPLYFLSQLGGSALEEPSVAFAWVLTMIPCHEAVRQYVLGILIYMVLETGDDDEDSSSSSSSSSLPPNNQKRPSISEERILKKRQRKE